MMPSLDAEKTELLFWDNSYMKEFEAKILEITKMGVVLDRTIFYPTGGGQFSDIGQIQLKSNKDVLLNVNSVEKIDGKIVHIIQEKQLDKLKISDIIIGRINWERRYNLMKAHSSQHVLSAMIVKNANIKTSKAVIDVSGVSIHLDKTIAKEKLMVALLETNKILSSELEIESNIVSKAKIPVSLRNNLRGHLEEIVSNKIRIVSIKGIDDSLCGGTHCKVTSEIGPLVLSDFKGDVITYVFGDVALEKMTNLSIGAITTAKLLASKPIEVFQRMEKVIKEFNEMKELNYQLVKSVVKSQMAEIKKIPGQIDAFQILMGDFSFAEKKHVLQELGELPDESIAIFIVKGPILLITSTSKKLPANKLIQIFIQQTKNNGGGSSSVAQSSVSDPEKDLKIVSKIIADFKQ